MAANNPPPRRLAPSTKHGGPGWLPKKSRHRRVRRRHGHRPGQVPLPLAGRHDALSPPWPFAPCPFAWRPRGAPALPCTSAPMAPLHYFCPRTCLTRGPRHATTAFPTAPPDRRGCGGRGKQVWGPVLGQNCRDLCGDRSVGTCVGTWTRQVELLLLDTGRHTSRKKTATLRGTKTILLPQRTTMQGGHGFLSVHGGRNNLPAAAPNGLRQVHAHPPVFILFHVVRETIPTYVDLSGVHPRTVRCGLLLAQLIPIQS